MTLCRRDKLESVEQTLGQMKQFSAVIDFTPAFPATFSLHD